MKKVILLAGLFLIGISAQAITNHQENVASTPGKHKRYNNAQNISFVENDIIFTVSTNGQFNFNVLNQKQHRNYRTRNNNHIGNYPQARSSGRYISNYQREYIKRDFYGNITQINRTPINYKKNGKVRSIGNVKLRYHKGRLIKVGGLDITYNRFGDIRDTFGFINTYNNFWHDRCNLNNVNHRKQHNGKADDRNNRLKGRRDKIKNKRS